MIIGSLLEVVGPGVVVAVGFVLTWLIIELILFVIERKRKNHDRRN